MLMLLIVMSSVGLLLPFTRASVGYENNSVHCLPSDLVECITFRTNSSRKTVFLQTLVYTITDNITTDVPELIIMGNGSTIHCVRDNIGLTFITITCLKLRNITIRNCGVFHISSSADKGYDNGAFAQVKAALYINSVEYVELLNVQIEDSTGIGLALVECGNMVVIEESTFKNNTSHHNPGGGGVYIELLNNCSREPTIKEPTVKEYSMKEPTVKEFSVKESTIEKTSTKDPTTYQILNCDFIDNTASTGIYSIKHFPLTGSIKNSHFFFGRGGGLSINLERSDVNMTLDGCKFEGNVGHRGGGIFVYFLPGCENNLIQITRSIFERNKCNTERIPHSIYSAGGGLGVLYITGSKGNNLSVESCNFINNTAFYGGAISMGTRKGDSMNSVFLVDSSNFTGNSARIGSAMDIFCYTTSEPFTLCIAQPTIRNSNFIENDGIYVYESSEGTTFSTVHLDDIKVKFSEEVRINGNHASGIGMEGAHLQIDPGAVVSIHKNTGRTGGGVTMLGDSEIGLFENSSLSIADNSATDRGGGIYVEQNAETFSVYSYSCFIKYKSDVNTHPDNWKVNVSFSGNTDNGGVPNAIFTSSIYPCVWPVTTNNLTSLSKNTTADVFNTFCNWKSWFFNARKIKCEHLIRTLPNHFLQEEYNSSLQNFNKVTKIANFSVLDDLNHDVTNNTTFSACITEQRSLEDTAVIVEVRSDGLRMTGPRGEYKVLVQTAYRRSISTSLNVTILDCPVGYGPSGKCTCIVQHRYLQCPGNGSPIGLFIGKCIGYDATRKDGERVIISKCPFTASFEVIMLHKGAYVPVTPIPSNLNKKFCSDYNRKGILCSQCKEDFGINIFSPYYQCVLCNEKNTYGKWIKAVGVIIAPQTLFFLLVIVFHIGITSAAMNSYIFFSHIIVLPLEVLLIQSGWALELKDDRGARLYSDLVLDPYRIWNFDYPEIFRVGVCLHPSMRIIHAIAFRYIEALYPIFLLSMTLLFIEMHARNCKPIVYLWRPLCSLCVRLRRNWELKTSTIDAFSTIILLSYSKILTISLQLLQFNYVKTLKGDKVEMRLDYDTSVIYFKDKTHLILAAIAIFMLCTFIAIPPVLLLFFPTRCFRKLLAFIKLDRWHALNIFVDTFQGYFKNGTNGSPERRWFSAFYFIFRVIVIGMFAFTDDLVEVHYRLAILYLLFLLLIVLLQPYKKKFYIYLDAIFMAILVIISIFIVYHLPYIVTSTKFPSTAWKLTYSIMFIPTLYILVYLLFLVCTRSRSSFMQRHFISNARRMRYRTSLFLANNTASTHNHYAEEEDIDDISFSITSDSRPTYSSLGNFSSAPDRVDNPHRYCKLPSEASCSIVSVENDPPEKPLKID